MQLVSLWVKDFKNLKDFTINFENQENLSIIIGNNGSGKSNILEAISAIFAELYGSASHIDNYNLKYNQVCVFNAIQIIVFPDNLLCNHTLQSATRYTSFL